jgi:hypothetical protein
MLILGWTTNDLRGRRAYAALWSNHDSPAQRASAMDYIQRRKLENAVLRWRDDKMELAEAKRQIIKSLL